MEYVFGRVTVTMAPLDADPPSETVLFGSFLTNVHHNPAITNRMKTAVNNVLVFMVISPS
jgi:hypothetical protein